MTKESWEGYTVEYRPMRICSAARNYTAENRRSRRYRASCEKGALLHAENTDFDYDLAHTEKREGSLVQAKIRIKFITSSVDDVASSVSSRRVCPI